MTKQEFQELERSPTESEELVQHDRRRARHHFRLLKSDPSMYIYEDEIGFVIKLNKQLMDRFETPDMGAVSRIFGMTVTRDREKRIIATSQKYYTEDVAHRYGMEAVTPRTTSE